MKTLLLSIMVPAIALMALKATATTLTNSGPLTLSWTITQGPTNIEYVSTTITHTSKETNYTTNYSAKATTLPSFQAGALLNLLGHSFGSNFAGDTLAVDSNGIVWVVTNKKTVIMDASSVVFLDATNTIVSGGAIYTKTIKTTKVGTNNVTTTNVTGTEGQTETSLVTLLYNDSKLITNDASIFFVGGVATFAIDGSISNTTATGTENFMLQNGSGGGKIRGINSIITGSITSNSKKTGK
jgi:hypothetical protein